MDDRGSISDRGRDFFFATAPRPVLGSTQPAAISTRVSPLGVKRPDREADHSPSPTEVKNAWSFISTPPYFFIAWSLIKGYVFLAWYLSTRTSHFTLLTKCYIIFML